MENANPVVVLLSLFLLFFIIFAPLSVLVLYVCSMILCSPMLLIHELISGLPPGNYRKTRITKESFITWANKRRLIKECKLWKIGKGGKKELVSLNELFQYDIAYTYEWIIVVSKNFPRYISWRAAEVLEKVKRRDIGKNIKDIFPFASKDVVIRTSNNNKTIAAKLLNLSYAWLRTKLILAIETEPFIFSDYPNLLATIKKNKKLVLCVPKHCIKDIKVNIT